MYVPQGDDSVDIGAVVCEIGTYAARLGFAGEDQPRSYFPSVSRILARWSQVRGRGNSADGVVPAVMVICSM